jgi:hypothetical protein
MFYIVTALARVDNGSVLSRIKVCQRNRCVRSRIVAIFINPPARMDNSSQPGGFAKAKKAVEYLNVEEIVTAFISFGGQATQEAKDLGFKNILDVSSSASELRRAFNCLSKSVIENSKSAVSKQDDFFDV